MGTRPAQSIGPTPPHNIEAEQGALGCMLLDTEARKDGFASLRPDDFYHSAHQFIFTALAILDHDGKPSNLVLVTDWLRETGHLDEVGGPAYLTGLVNNTFAPGLITHYAAIVRRDSTKRRLLMMGQQLQTRSANGEPVDSLIDDMRTSMDMIAADSGTAEIAAIPYETLTTAGDTPPAPIVEHFLFPQTITLLAGSAKVGKTQLALHLAQAIVTGGRFMGLEVPTPASVLYLGQEDTQWTLRERVQSIRDSFGEVRAGYYLVATKGLLLEGGGVRRIVAQHRPEVLILDPFRRFHIREEDKSEMALVLRAIDLLVRDFRCAVVILAHTRKTPADQRNHKPEISDVRGHSVVIDQANTIALLSADADQGIFTLNTTSNFAVPQTIHLKRDGSVFTLARSPEGMTVAEAVDIFGDQPSVSRGQAVKLLQGVGWSRTTAYRHVDALVTEGWLAKDSAGGFSMNPNLLGSAPTTRLPLLERKVQLTVPSGKVK